MEVVNATNESIAIFAKVLNESAAWLNSIDQPMWNILYKADEPKKHLTVGTNKFIIELSFSQRK